MVDALTQQTKSLEDQLEIFKGSLKANSPDPATIYLGDGYFASVPLAHAKDFLERKIKNIERELDTLHQIGRINEEGLPILDIVEQLDDDGHIVESTVNRTGLNARFQCSAVTREPENNSSGKAAQSAKRHSIDEKEEIFNNDKETTSSSTNISNQFNGPSASVEKRKPVDDEDLSNAIIRSSDDNDIQYIEDVTSFNDNDDSRHMEDKSVGEYRDIDPAEILELQLTDEPESDEEPVDFDFDDLEEDDAYEKIYDESGHDDDNDEDDDDDDEVDDDSYDWLSTKGSLFPQDEATKRLIALHLAQQSHLAELDNEEDDVSQKKNEDLSGDPRRVHFSDKVDICEFETTSDERKLTVTDILARKPSRFKAARQNSHIPKRSLEKNPGLPSSSPRKPGISAAAIAAAAVVSKSPPKQVHGIVKERETPKTHPKRSFASSPLKPVGRVPRPDKSHPRESVPTPQISKAASANSVSESGNTRIAVNSSLVRPSESAGLPKQDEDIRAIQSQTTTMDPPRALDETKASERSNSSEHAIAPELIAPIASPDDLKKKIEQDANKIYDDSFIPDDEYLRLHDELSEEDPKSIPEKPDFKSLKLEHPESDRPIMSESIMERPVDNNDEWFDDDDDDENKVNMKEIKKEYQRLRQNLIYGSGGFTKKEAEKAVEPINENGEVKKVSRFKAAHI